MTARNQKLYCIGELLIMEKMRGYGIIRKALVISLLVRVIFRSEVLSPGKLFSIKFRQRDLPIPTGLISADSFERLPCPLYDRLLR